MTKIVITLSLLISVCLSFSGCVLVPFINTAKQAGILQSDRERLLTEEVTKFQRVRFWGNPMQGMAFAADETRDEIQNFLRKTSKDQKVVESEVEFIDYSNDSYQAEVSAKVRYYKIPYYVVEERIETQEWIFSVATGWKLAYVSIDGKA